MAISYIAVVGITATFILLLDALVYMLVNSFDPWWFWTFFSIGLFLGILVMILGSVGVN